MTDAVLYQQEGGVVTLTLNQPETRNALSEAIITALLGHVQRINADLSVGCVIVTGAGLGFSSGGNVKKIRERSGMFSGSAAEIRLGYQNGIQQIPLAMHGLQAPSIAAVHGAAIGAGCDLAAMCDIRIAARSAQFAESFLRLGLISGDGGAWFLPRVVGWSKACEMTFTGDVVGAEEALRIGLVSQLVDDDKLLEAAQALAQRIAAQPVHSLRMSKRLLRDSQQSSLPHALELASALQAIAHQTHDQQEAVQAFVEKRPPKFEAR